MVLNGPDAMHSTENRVNVINGEGKVIASFHGPKTQVAMDLFHIIQKDLIDVREAAADAS